MEQKETQAAPPLVPGSQLQLPGGVPGEFYIVLLSTNCIQRLRPTTNHVQHLIWLIALMQSCIQCFSLTQISTRVSAALGHRFLYGETVSNWNL